MKIYILQGEQFNQNYCSLTSSLTRKQQRKITDFKKLN